MYHHAQLLERDTETQRGKRIILNRTVIMMQTQAPDTLLPSQPFKCFYTSHLQLGEAAVQANCHRKPGFIREAPDMPGGCTPANEYSQFPRLFKELVASSQTALSSTSRGKGCLKDTGSS
jgi:hypothetical protein